MPDEVVDTTVSTPAEAASEPAADSTPVDNTPDVNMGGEETPPEPPPETPPPAPAPPLLTQAEILAQAEEKAFQRTATWIGRRDKELFDNIAQVIDRKIQSVQPPAPPPPPIDPATLLENPEAWLRQAAPRVLGEMAQREQQKVTNYNNELVRNIGTIVGQDELFADTGDKVAAKEILDEVTARVTQVDRRLPPEVAARMVMNDSISSVFKKRLGTKPNPLAGNKPQTTPTGTIKPPPVQARALKPVKLSADAEMLAKRWGYKQEDIAKLFAEA